MGSRRFNGFQGSHSILTLHYWHWNADGGKLCQGNKTGCPIQFIRNVRLVCTSLWKLKIGSKFQKGLFTLSRLAHSLTTADLDLGSLCMVHIGGGGWGWGVGDELGVTKEGEEVFHFVTIAVLT